MTKPKSLSVVLMLIAGSFAFYKTAQGAVLFVQAAGVEGGFTSSSVSLAFESDVTSGNVIAVFAP